MKARRCNTNSPVVFFEKVKKKILNIINKGIGKTKVLETTKVEYRYNNFSILLPSHHLLPQYQKNHPKYDRFLPHLVKYIELNQTIVDVGANCGDSLAGMIEKNHNVNFICIEPDEAFFSLLEANINRIKKIHSNTSIQAVKQLVGKSITKVTLEGANGSKHAVLDQQIEGYYSRTLDQILSDLNNQNIRLLKSDVDGFDYDVIDSAENTLTKQNPMIFFECQNDFESQKESYIKTISWLGSIGYKDWTIFDNFGQQIVRTKDLQLLFQLIDYIWQQNMKLTTRTIYYLDILAITERDCTLIDKVLFEYK